MKARIAFLQDFNSQLVSKAFVFCWLGLLLLFPLRLLADNNQWTGTWNTVWRDGGAQMILEQQGGQVFGSYQPFDGIIEAKVEGNVLKGRWVQKNRQGSFIFTLSPDGKTFLGRFDSGEWWNGEISPEQLKSPLQSINLETPMASLKSFLINFNLVKSGKFQYSTLAQRSLNFSNYNSPSPRSKALIAQDYFSVIEQTTLRIWDLNQLTDGDDFQFELNQAGTEIKTPLLFNKNSLGQWQIVVPPQKLIAKQKQALLKARKIISTENNDHLNLTNPRDALRTFIEQIKLWDKGGKQHVLKSMDVSQISESIREQEAAIRAEYLKHILDRISYVIWQEIPNDPSSQRSYIHFQHPLGNIVVSPYSEDGKTIWKFDAATIANVKSLHLAFEEMPLVEGIAKDTEILSFFKLRQAMRAYPWLMISIFETELWQWISLIIITAMSWILSKYIAQSIVQLVRWIRALLRIKPGQGKVTEFYGPTRITLIALFWQLSIDFLGLPEKLYLAISWAASFTLIMGLGWMAMRITDWFGEHHRTSSLKTKTHMDEIMVSLIVGLVKVLIVAISAVLIAKVMAIPYQSILAGLGIGGLAVAFAARETIADFFGSAVLLADRPFRQNDRVNIGDVQGYVEYVGLRSTQIRTLDDSIVTIPNSRLAHEVIDNRRKRNARHFKINLSITLDTSNEKIELFICKVKELVINLDEGVNDKVHCGIWEFGPSSINLQLFCYLKAENREQEYLARNHLMSEILKLARNMKIEFAYPTRTLYMQQTDSTEPK